jgi:polyhydroxybutyrate depolymerase
MNRLVTQGLLGLALAALSACSGGGASPDVRSFDVPADVVDEPGADGVADADAAEFSGCAGPVLAPGDYTRTQVFDGIERTWTVHVPPLADASTRLPLVVNLHPFVLGGNATFHRIWRLESGLEALADVEGFVVVQPDGTGKPAAWNAGEACCGDASEQQVDDVGFVLALIEWVSAEACIDARRVYATGMSNGGYLSHRLACEAPDRVAAIAPVVGGFSAELLGVAGARAVPVLQISGSLDNLPNRVEAVARWVASNECNPAPEVTYAKGTATCETWTGCRDGVEVTHCIVDGGGHCWFSDHPFQYTPDCDATEDLVSEHVVWQFLSRWQLP